MRDKMKKILLILGTLDCPKSNLVKKIEITNTDPNLRYLSV